MAQQEIGGEWDWPFLRRLDILQTVADITTGTVSINAADTALTFSSAPAASVQNRFIQFSATDDWYQITSHTAASTSATIDPAYNQTSNLSGGTYIVRKVYYGLDSTLSGVISVMISESPRRLISLSPMNASNLLPFLGSTGIPSYYHLDVSASSTGLPQIAFYPTPAAAYNIYVASKTQMTNMSASTNTSIIPVQYHGLVINKAAMFAFQKLDDTRYQLEKREYDEGIEKMKSVYRQDIGRHRVMRSVDGTGEDAVFYTWPAQFGPMSNV